jgi:hypothetical protein
MIPSSLVLYQDHSPVAYRQYSYRDFMKFYPWAEANGLAAPLPPPKANMVITPYNAVYPSPDALFPHVNYASVLTLPYLQFHLSSGDFRPLFSPLPRKTWSSSSVSPRVPLFSTYSLSACRTRQLLGSVDTFRMMTDRLWSPIPITSIWLVSHWQVQPRNPSLLVTWPFSTIAFSCLRLCS